MQADTVADDVAAMLRLAAEPVQAGELIGEQIRRAARRCGLTFSRARKLWYRECHVSVVDFIAITQAVAQSNETLIAYQDVKARLLRARLAEARVRP